MARPSFANVMLMVAICGILAATAIVWIWRAMISQADEFSRDLLPIPPGPPSAYLLVDDGIRRNAQAGVMTLYSWPVGDELQQYSVGEDWPRPSRVPPLRGDMVALRLDTPAMPAVVQLSRVYPADIGKKLPLRFYRCHNRRMSPSTHHPCDLSIVSTESGEGWDIEIPLSSPPGEYLLLASVTWSEFPAPGIPAPSINQAGANWFFSIEKAD